jgi:hypothetical protein
MKDDRIIRDKPEFIAALFFTAASCGFLGFLSGVLWMAAPRVDWGNLNPRERYEIIMQDEELRAIFEKGK